MISGCPQKRIVSRACRRIRAMGCPICILRLSLKGSCYVPSDWEGEAFHAVSF